MKIVLLVMCFLFFSNVCNAKDLVVNITIKEDVILRIKEAISSENPKPQEYTWEEWTAKVIKEYLKNYLLNYERSKAIESAYNSVEKETDF